MGRRRPKAGYTDKIRVGPFRSCWIGEDKVEVTPGIGIVSQGFLFDRIRQVVTIRDGMLGITLSEEEIPFSDIVVRVKSYNRDDEITQIGTGYFIEMRIARRRRGHVQLRSQAGVDVFEVCGGRPFDSEWSANHIVAAIQGLGVKTDSRPEL